MVTLCAPRMFSVWLGPGTAPQLARTKQSLQALLMYAGLGLVQHAAVLSGLVDLRESSWLTVFYLTGALGFHALIRSGLNERLPCDPSLMLPQMVLGALAVVGLYAIAGPARGAAMSLLVVMLVFGMFELRPRQARGLALFAFMLLALAMAWMCGHDPARYPPAVEAVHLLLAAIVLASAGVLSARMALVQARIKKKESELDHALEQIRQLACRDELTGLSNRRHMTELMAIEKARQRRTGQPMALALLDIDMFRRVNDTYGQNGGDLVLKTFAQLTRDSLRSSDVMGRWGGEEFLLMLPDTTSAEAIACVDRMRTQLARLSADAISPGLRVTFSAGVADVSGGDDIEVAIERADQAVSRAKRQGRNCTVVHQPPGAADAFHAVKEDLTNPAFAHAASPLSPDESVTPVTR